MFKHSLKTLEAYLKKLTTEAALGKGWQTADQSESYFMVFATCQQQPKAIPVVIGKFGFPV